MPMKGSSEVEGVKRRPSPATGGHSLRMRDAPMPPCPSGTRRCRSTGFQAHLDSAPMKPHHEMDDGDDSKRRGKHSRSTNDPGQEFHESTQDSVVGLDWTTRPPLEPVKNT